MYLVSVKEKYHVQSLNNVCVEALYQDAADILLPEAYGEAIEETGIKPVDQPEVNVTQIEKAKTLNLKQLLQLNQKLN